MRAAALALFLLGCPSSSLRIEHTAECCELDAGPDGGCEWTTARYSVPRGAGAISWDDEDACRAAGLEPWGER